MFDYTLNGEPLAYGPFTVGDTQYSAQHLDVLTDEELVDLGVTRSIRSAVAPTAADRLEALAALRWQKSQVFIYDSVLTQADPAIAVVNATLSLRERRGVPPEAPQTWKLSNADFRQWNEAQIEAFGFAVADHIQACFDREEALTALILAAEEPAAIDIMTGWPG